MLARARPLFRFRLAVIPLTAMVACALVGATSASFSAKTVNPVSAFSAAPDWSAPIASASEITLTGGGSTLRPGSSYYVYAAVSDGGNPASGTQAVTADVSSLTSGANTVPLAAGSWTIGSTTYNRRSAALTVDYSTTGGTKAYSLKLTDNTGNTRTQNGFSADVANPPTERDSASSSSGAAGSINDLDVPMPNALAGDTLFAAIVSGSTSASISAGGWTLYASDISSGLALYIFRRTATGSEPASYTFSSTSGSRMVGGIAAYGDVGDSDLNAGASETAPVATHTTGSLAVPDGTRLLSIFADSAGTAGPRSWTSTGSERVDVTTNDPLSSDVSLSIYDSAVLPAGTYQRTATSTATSKNASMWLIALSP